MGIAALILGIISLVLGFNPFCNIFALLPAIVGLTLGIIDWVKKKKSGEPKGKAVAGTICSGVAIIIIMIYYFTVVLVANKAASGLSDWAEELKSTDWSVSNSSSDYDSDYDYDYDY